MSSRDSDTDEDGDIDDPRSSPPPKPEDYGSYGENSSPLTVVEISDSDHDSVSPRGSPPLKRGRLEPDLPDNEISQDTQHLPGSSTQPQDPEQFNTDPTQTGEQIDSSGDENSSECVSDLPEQVSPCQSGSISSSSYNGSDSDNSDFHNDVNELLYEGSTRTTDEAVLDVCNIFLKNRWTKASLKDTLKYMSSTLPLDNNMPQSLYMLQNYVGASTTPCQEEAHYYCSRCFKVKGNKLEACCRDSESDAFYVFSFADQIKFLFEQHNLADAIDNYKEIRSRLNPQENCLYDILDGTEYQRVKKEASGSYDIILMWATDGVSLSDSSNVKMYPVVSQVCEVAPSLRSYFNMVNCVWVDEKAPDFNTILTVLAEDLKNINEAGGVEWKHPKTNITFKSRVFAPLLIGDAPIRADALKVMRYNSVRGCEKCEQVAKKLPPREGENRSLRRFVFQESPATQRTSERMRLQGIHAESNGDIHCKGVKAGTAAIEGMPLLNRSTCTVAEYMHSAVLGITLYFTKKWFSKPGPWYIGRCREAIDQFLVSIKVLDFMRDSRKMKDLALFKASELRAWLLFYSPVVLRNPDFRFPDDYYQHWLLFVKSMYILLQDKITESDLKSADIMLRCFLRQIGTLYSDYDYLYNIHQISHYVTYVREWGPFPFTSAFPFESYYGVLNRMVHGTKHHAKEIIENIKLAHCIHVLNEKVNNSRGDSKVTADVEIARLKAGAITLGNEHVQFLKGEGITEFENFRRAIYMNVAYTTSDYDRTKKKSNSLIEFLHQGSKCTGEILCFVKTPNKTVCLVETFVISQQKIIVHHASKQKISHLRPVEKSGAYVLVKFSSIISKVFKVGDYIAILPNKFERNL